MERNGTLCVADAVLCAYWQGHGRNVGGRQAHAPGPAHIPQDDADMSDPDDGAGGTEAEAGQLEPESG